MEKKEFFPQDYLIKRENASVRWTLEKLIGRKIQKKMLLGTVPRLSDDGFKYEFSLFPKDGYREPNDIGKAVLICGKKGSGKTALEEAFVYELVSEFGESVYHYNIPLEEFADCPDEVFDKLEKLGESEEMDSCLSIVTFGNIDSLLEDEKSVKQLEKFANKVKRSNKAVFLITAETLLPFDEIPHAVSSEFSCIPLKNPDFQERTEYFAFFRSCNSCVQAEYPDEMLSEITDGFSFQTLTELMEQLYLWAQGEISDDEDAEEIIMGISERTVTIPTDVIDSVLTGFRKKQKAVTEEAIAPVVYQNTPVYSVQEKQPEIPQKTFENNGNSEADARMNPERIEENIQTISQIKEHGNTIIPPMKLKHNQ